MHEHERWLEIVREDLAAAKGLLKLGLFSTVVYHCQQAAEKTFKAYLVFKEQPILKTHDLIKLLESCIKIDSGFQKQLEAASYINPFASRFRYPTEFDIPDLDEAKLAIKHAESIMRFVVKRIAEPETGQADIFDSNSEL